MFRIGAGRGRSLPGGTPHPARRRGPPGLFPWSLLFVSKLALAKAQGSTPNLVGSVIHDPSDMVFIQAIVPVIPTLVKLDHCMYWVEYYGVESTLTSR